MSGTRALRRLESLRLAHGGDAAEGKLASIATLRRSRLRTAAEVLRLHEALCFLRAYPDDARVLGAVESALAAFSRRADLRRHAAALADTGIEGTAIRYRFFWPMASRLARRWPGRLRLDWDDPGFEGRLRAALPSLVTWAEAEGLRRSDVGARAAIDRLRGPVPDGTFFVRRVAAMRGNDLLREAFHDAVDASYVLEPGPGGPSRTRERWAGVPAVYRSEPPSRARPDLLREIARPPRTVRALPPREGARLVDLACEAMVTRARDLDAFSHGDPRDVLLVDDGDSLAFAAIGTVPERRLMLPAVYGFLTLRGGVPIGYVQADALFGNVEIAFNTFESFRGGEAAHVFARVLAASRHLFGATSFSIEPYQLGAGNDEGIASGAWWFYHKLGFVPRDRGVRALARRELARLKRNPRHRSSDATLEHLAARHLFLEFTPGRPAVLSPTEALAAVASRVLSALAGADREAAVAECCDEARSRLGARRLPAAERLWWERWAPIVSALPGLDRWTDAERRALAEIIRAKAGRREIEYVQRFDAHPRLGKALLALAARKGPVSHGRG